METLTADAGPTIVFCPLQFGHAGEGVETQRLYLDGLLDEVASIRPRR